MSKAIMVLLFLCLNVFAGDGTLPPKDFFNSVFFESNSVLIAPHDHFHGEVDKLIKAIDRVGGQIYLVSGPRERSLSKNIISIPVSSVGEDRGPIMPSFMRNNEDRSWMMIEGGYGTVAREVGDWFANYFDITVLSHNRYNLRNKLFIDGKRNCFTVGNQISDSDLKDNFHCNEIIRYACYSRHCRLENHILFLKNGVVITTENVLRLKSLGYSRIYSMPWHQREALTDVLVLGNHLFYFYSYSNWIGSLYVKSIYKRAGYKVHSIGVPKGKCLGISAFATALPKLNEME